MYTLPILNTRRLSYGYQEYYQQLHYLLVRSSAEDSNYSILPDVSTATPAGSSNVADVAAPLSPL